MPFQIIFVFSVLVYLLAIYLLWKKRIVQYIFVWPINLTLKNIWIVWIAFLFLAAPLSFHSTDMSVWVHAANNLMEGKLLPHDYVYLPIFAEFLASLLYPFTLFIKSYYLTIFIVHLPSLLAYIYAPKLMISLTKKQNNLTPLGIVIAPVTIFYLFFGTNHILMFFLMGLSLLFLKKKKFLLAGIFAFLSCYKYLMIPTLLVLEVAILIAYGFKKLVRFNIGGLISLLPTIIYYIYDSNFLIHAIINLGAIGGHAKSIDPFHFLSILTRIPQFEYWYIQGHIWFGLIILSTFFCIYNLIKKKINLYQALGLSAIFVALFSLEPFRLEPAIGFIWIDSIIRMKFRTQRAIFIVLMVHILQWYPLASSKFLELYTPLTNYIVRYGGLFLGLSLVYLIYEVFRSSTGENIKIEI